jgi:TP901 family phage tail tape measure protein
METTADLLTTSIRAFGMEASQAGQISDVMANAVNKSKLTVDKLRTAFNYVGPAAHASGTSIEEVAGAMMVLANSGLRASTIGTGLRQVFARLVAPSARLREAFESHNIALEDLDIRLHGFRGVLENIADVFVDMETGAVDSRKAFELFGLRGANAILALVRGIKSGEYRDAIDSVYEVGTASSMASIQLEGLSLQIKNLSDKLKTFAIEVGGTGFTSVFRGALKVIREFVDLLTIGVKTVVGDTVVSFLSFTTAAYALTLALGLLSKGVKWLTIRLTALFVKMATTPMGIFILSIGAIFTALRAWSNQSKKNLEEQEELAIKLAKSSKVLGSYRRRLKEAYEIGTKNEKLMFKYTRLIERLIHEFPELSNEINAAKDNWLDLDSALEKVENRLSDSNIVAQMKAITEQFIIIEKQKIFSGIIDTLKNIAKTIASGKEFDPGVKPTEEFKKKLQATEGILDRITLIIKELGKDSKKVAGEQVKSQEAINGIIEAQIEKFKKSKLTISEIATKIREFASESNFAGDASEQASSKIVMAIGDVDEKALKSGNKLEYIISQVLAGVTAFRMEIENIEDPFASLTKVDSVFKNIYNTATAFQKVDLISKFKQMEQAISAYREAMSKQEGGITEDVEMGVAAIRVKFHKQFLDIIKDEGEAKWKQKEAEIKTLRELQTAYYQNYQDRITQEETVWKSIIEIKAKSKTEYLALEKKMMQDLNAKSKIYVEDYVRVRKAIQERINKIEKEAVYERTAFEYEQEITNARAIADQRIHEIEMVSIREGNLSEMARDKIASIEVDLAQKIYNLRVDLYEKVKKLYNKDRDEYISARGEVIGAEKSLNDAIKNQVEKRIDLTNEYYQERLKTIHDEYREAKLSEEDYLIFLKEAKARGLLVYQEYEERKALLTGNYWTRFQAGVKAANKEIKTLGELAFHIGTEISRVFSEGFVDAFSEFINSTEEAGKAFEKFAIDMLDWIGKMIMQLLVMRAVQAGLGFIGGGGTPAEAPAARGLPGTAAPINQPVGGFAVAHSGGCYGPRPISSQDNEP